MAAYLILIITTVLGLIGLWLIVRGIRGRYVLSEPRCAKCGFDLRRMDGAYERCPECGTDLEAGRRILFARTRRRPSTIVAGLLVLVLAPAFAIGAQRIIAAMNRPVAIPAPPRRPPMVGPAVTAQLTNEEVSESLTQQFQQPYAWREIEKRRRAGTMSDELIVGAIERLIEHLETDKVETDGVRRLSWGDEERRIWRDAGIITDDMHGRLALAAHRPRVQIASRARVGEQLSFRVSMLGIVGGVFEDLVRVLGPDGDELQWGEGEGPHPALRRPWVRLDLPPGSHELTFEVKMTYVDPLVMRARRSDPFTRPEFPADAPCRTRLVKETITVVAEDAALVETVTDPDLEPGVRAALRPRRLSAAPMPGGGAVFSIDSNSLGEPDAEPPVGLAMRGYLRDGERRWELCRLHREDGGTSMGSGTLKFEDFPTDVETIDVVFEPDPEYGRNSEGPIWGEDVVFEDVPIRWVAPANPKDR